jgi:hypothetical protein
LDTIVRAKSEISTTTVFSHTPCATSSARNARSAASISASNSAVSLVSSKCVSHFRLFTKNASRSVPSAARIEMIFATAASWSATSESDPKPPSSPSAVCSSAASYSSASAPPSASACAIFAL